MSKRIAIIGGPGTGKTAVINRLEDSGYRCLHEVSREVIQQAQKEGVDQLFLENPILFSELLLKGRIAQFESIATFTDPFLFYDRGIQDVVAYLHYIQQDFPAYFDEACKKYRYDMIFILPPWKSIYISDNERYENFEQAEKIYRYLSRTYYHYGFQPVEVPKTTIAQRADFILKKVIESEKT